MVHVDLTTELFYASVWNNISDRTLWRDPVRITRGIANEGGRSAPTTIGLSLENRDGRFSVKHPASPLFGLLGRNAPIRAYLGTPHPSAANSSLTDTTDQVAPSVDAPTGDGLLLCAWAAPAESDTYALPGSMTTVHSLAVPEVGLEGGAVMEVGSEAIAAAGPTGTRTAVLGVAEDYVAASVLLHGTAPAIVDSDISAAAGFQTVTGLQVDDWLVVFAYFGWEHVLLQPPQFPTDAREGGWILLADTGTLRAEDLDATFMRMKVWARRVRTAGEHRVMVDRFGPADSPARVLSSVVAVSGVGQWVLRGHAEVASMPPRQDVSGRDRWVPVEAAGILRRLGASTAKPLQSALYRFTSRLPGLPSDPAGTPSRLVRHWPLENDQVREGIPDRDIQLLAIDEEPEFGPVPTFGADAGPPGTPRSMLLRPTHSVLFRARAGAGWAVQLWLTPGDPARDGAAGSWFIGAKVAGDAFLSWDHETGGIGLFLQDEDGLSAGSDTDTFLPDGGPMLVTMFCDSTGQVVTATVNQLNSGTQVHLVTSSAAKPFLVNLSGVDVTNSATFGATITGRDVYVSHLAVGQRVSWQGNGEIAQQALRAGAGHAGETAGRRLLRLCAEENIPLAMIGDPDDTEMVGPQKPATLLELLHECETVDHGILHEPREALALAYRTRINLYNQPAAATLDGASGELAMPWQPDPDDLLIRNDVTVTMPDGTQSRSVQEAGPLNVSDPADSADGVGRYDVDIPMNVASRLRLPDHASWLRRLGTVDEPRFPSIAVSVLRELVLSENQALVDALARLDIGDRIVIINPPDDLPPNDVQQLWVGSAETLTHVDWDLAGNTVPASPYTLGVWAGDAEVPAPDAPQRYSPYDSRVETTFLTGTDTALVVEDQTGGNDLWSQNPDFPYDILVRGVRLRVTAVGAPTGAVQTLTVQQAPINGVSGVTIQPGEQVELWAQARYAL